MAKAVLGTEVPAGRVCSLLPEQRGRSPLTGSSQPFGHRAVPRLRAAQQLSMSPGIQKVEALDEGHFICVKWEDGSESSYPSVWLRDNCQCPLCFLPSAGARRLLFEDLDVNVVLKQVVLADRKKVFEANHYLPSREACLTMLINLNSRQFQVIL